MKTLFVRIAVQLVVLAVCLSPLWVYIFAHNKSNGGIVFLGILQVAALAVGYGVSSLLWTLPSKNIL